MSSVHNHHRRQLQWPFLDWYSTHHTEDDSIPKNLHIITRQWNNFHHLSKSTAEHLFRSSYKVVKYTFVKLIDAMKTYLDKNYHHKKNI